MNTRKTNQYKVNGKYKYRTQARHGGPHLIYSSERQSSMDLCDTDATLIYTVSSRPARACEKKQKQKNTKQCLL